MTDTLKMRIKHAKIEESVSSRLRATANAPAAPQAQDIDWDFTTRSEVSLLEKIHPYPAKFIPEIPSALIKLYPPSDGSVILDPFCGSGTTLVEAQRQGHRAVGVDLNPIACLMSAVKTSQYKGGLLEASSAVIKMAKSSEASIPNIPNLDHWFSIDVQKTLAKIIFAIRTFSSKDRDRLRIALSSIIVKISRQESDTRYAAIDKNINRNDVYKAFEDACTRLHFALLERDYPLTNVKIIERNALKLTKKDFPKPVGLVVTSPPYPNAYEYWLYHKYRMFWLGFDPLAVKKDEIGARAHFFKKNHHTEEDFPRQISMLLGLISDIATKDVKICFVVGRSKIHGKIINNANHILNVAKDHGFELAFEAERLIAASRKSFNLSHANIKTETLLVLKRK